MGDSGLQSLNIVSIVVAFVVSLFVVIIRIWRRAVDCQFGIGKNDFRNSRHGANFSQEMHCS